MRRRRISAVELELQAFLDGETPPQKQREMSDRIATDPALAREAADLRALQARLDELASTLDRLPMPARLARAAGAPPPEPVVPPPPGRRFARRIWATGGIVSFGGVVIVTAALLFVVGPRTGGGVSLRQPLIVEALAARDGSVTPLQLVSLDADPLSGVERRSAADRIVTGSLGPATRTPDLRHIGFRLVSVALFPGKAVQLRYRDNAGHVFVVYAHRGRGPDRFALLSRGSVRICLWQNEEASAVMSGDVANSELFRLSSLVYVSMQL